MPSSPASALPPRADASVTLSHASLALRWLLASLLVIASVVSFQPFTPAMPGSDLDGSWCFGLDEAVARGLRFGTEVVFTFGPYAFVYNNEFNPATDALRLGGSLSLALASGLCLALLLWSAPRRWALAWWLVLVVVTLARDVQFFLYPLLVTLLVFRCVQRDEAARPPPMAQGLLVPLMALFGLLPLIKGTGLLLALGCGALCLWLLVAAGRWRTALLAPVAALGVQLACWRLAGQQWTDLPAYYSGLLATFGGYTDAMSLPGRTHHVGWYLLAALAIVLAAARVAAPLQLRMALTLAFALYLFVAWKGGFVRHDAHALMAGNGVLAAALLLPTLQRGARLLPPLLLSLLAWYPLERDFGDTFNQPPWVSALELHAKAWRGLAQRVSDPQAWPRRFEEAVSGIRHQFPLPALAGRSDVYGTLQSAVLAAGLPWAPRPVMQSYLAYRPALAERNRAHLLGPAAPDNVLFQVDPIDGRLPALEDGPSWPLLFSLYRPQAMAGPFAVLKRRADLPAAPQPLRSVSSSHQLGESVSLPPAEAGTYTFVRLALHPSLAGTVLQQLYKISPLMIEVELVDGRRQRFRLPVGSAAAGFVLSPLIENTPEFMLMHDQPAWLADKAVRSFSVQRLRGPAWLWQGGYRMELSSYRRPEPIGVSQGMIAFDRPAAQLAPDRPAEAGACSGSIDRFNGGPTPAAGQGATRLSTQLALEGWLSASDPAGEAAEDVQVTLTDAQGRTLLIPARRVPRPDVASFLQRPALAQSGFSIHADVMSLRGAYRVGLMRRQGTQWLRCPAFDLPVLIERPA